MVLSSITSVCQKRGAIKITIKFDNLTYINGKQIDCRLNPDAGLAAIWTKLRKRAKHAPLQAFSAFAHAKHSGYKTVKATICAEGTLSLVDHLGQSEIRSTIRFTFHWEPPT